MESAVYQVSAFWDEEATVWVATSEDVPGLATEADTIEALSQKLRDIVPDLLMSNHVIAANYTGAIAIPLDHQERLTDISMSFVPPTYFISVAYSIVTVQKPLSP